MIMNVKAIPNPVIQGQFLSSECVTFGFFGVSTFVLDVLLVVAVSFGEIKSVVKLEVNALEPKLSSNVTFLVFCFVVDVADVADSVDIVAVAGEVESGRGPRSVVVEFSFSVMVVLFNSLILFISGKILIVAENFFIAFKRFVRIFLFFTFYIGCIFTVIIT